MIIIRYDVGGCAICISNEVEYLDKEWSYINSTKEVALRFNCSPNSLGPI